MAAVLGSIQPQPLEFAAEGSLDLQQIAQLSIDSNTVQTNMVFIDCATGIQEPLINVLKQKGILIGGYDQLRLVTHLDISDSDIPIVIKAFQEFFQD